MRRIRVNKGEWRDLGDAVERAVKPFARALKLSCLDDRSALKPDSPCAQRRDKLNALGAQLKRALTGP